MLRAENRATLGALNSSGPPTGRLLLYYRVADAKKRDWRSGRFSLKGVAEFHLRAVSRFSGVEQCDIGDLSFGGAPSLGGTQVRSGGREKAKIFIDIARRRVV